MSQFCRLLAGDCRDVLPTLADASVDALVCDPPAGIGFMNLAFDSDRGGRQHWIAWLAGIMVECRRIVRPGAYALVWALPRTSHWTATAVEDAGWIVQDVITHHFATGFPKHKNALKPASENWILAYRKGPRVLRVDACRISAAATDPNARTNKDGVAGTTKSSYSGGLGNPGRGWDGATGRWPANTIFSHTEACVPLGTQRVKGSAPMGPNGGDNTGSFSGFSQGKQRRAAPQYTDSDGTEEVDAYHCHPSCPVAELDRQSGNRSSGFLHYEIGEAVTSNWRKNEGRAGTVIRGISAAWEPSTGGASRFFYVTKPSAAERSRGLAGRNQHVTVKSIELMHYLCRLITPPAGIILDPFMGSGSTGLAALGEGFSFIGIDQDAGYVELARQRLGLLATIEEGTG